MGYLATFDHPILTQPYQAKPHNLLSLRKKKNFFLSFTDAFICLVKTYNIAKEEIILLPDFYCPETIETMSEYMRIELYHVKSDLTHDAESYIKAVQTYHPSVILHYSLGPFYVSEQEVACIKNLPSNTIIIDDYAHKILTDEVIRPFTSNHFYIDSIRKYSPFLGSHLINPAFTYSSEDVSWYSWHTCKVQLLQWFMDLLNFISIRTHVTSVTEIGNTLYERQDHELSAITKPNKGHSFSYYAWNFLNIKAIKEHRRKIAKLYKAAFSQLDSLITIPITDESYYSELIFYPILIKNNKRNDLVHYLNEKGIYAESLWKLRPNMNLNEEIFSEFLILPLTSEITGKTVDYIYNEIHKFMAG
jgi:hypothetical protein